MIIIFVDAIQYLILPEIEYMDSHVGLTVLVQTDELIAR
jgi:hypothetical protein